MATCDASRAALADQVEAANAEQARVLAEISRIFKSEHRADLTPFAQEMVARFALGYIIGTTNMCLHLSLVAPQPGNWAPWMPGRIRCGLCFAQAGRRKLTGTRADHTCDSCGRVARGQLRMASVAMPGAVVDGEPTGRPFAWPPVSIHFGLCPACVDGQGGAQTR